MSHTPRATTEAAFLTNLISPKTSPMPNRPWHKAKQIRAQWLFVLFQRCVSVLSLLNHALTHLYLVANPLPSENCTTKSRSLSIYWINQSMEMVRGYAGIDEVECTYSSLNGDRMQLYLDKRSTTSRRSSTGMAEKNLGRSESGFMYFHCRPDQRRSRHQCVLPVGYT